MVVTDLDFVVAVVCLRIGNVEVGELQENSVALWSSDVVVALLIRWIETRVVRRGERPDAVLRIQIDHPTATYD